MAAFDRRRGGAPSTAAFWRWKYFDNPAGPACVATARVGEDIVGTLGFLPVRVRVQGREVIATQQVDVAIMAEYRGGGIYFQLAFAMIEEGAKRGIDFGFGFATEQTRALSVDFLGFDLVGPIHRMAKVLDYGHYAGALLGPRVAGIVRGVRARARGRKARRSTPLAGNIAAVGRFDERFDRLVAEVIQAPIAVVRNAAYLNWRYADCPTVPYRRYAVATESSVTGFIIFHAHEADGVVRGIIDELACSPDDPDAVEGLLSAALSDLAAEGAVNAICWLPTWHPMADKLRGLGFRDREARNELIVLRNKTPGVDFEHLTEERNWYYTHGDSDFHVRSA